MGGASPQRETAAGRQSPAHICIQPHLPSSPPPLLPSSLPPTRGLIVLRAVLLIKVLQDRIHSCLPVSLTPASGFLGLPRTTFPFVGLIAL